MKTEDMAKTTFRMVPEEMKKLKIYCLKNDTTLQAFLYNAAQYCMKNNILPPDKE